jgi:hypothetical protein
MKRASWAAFGIVVGYMEFRADIDFWLPSFGAEYDGHALGQIVALGILAVFVFGSVVFMGYRALNWIFE